MSIDEFLDKKYELASSENFDEYMKALDVHGVLRKVAVKLHPVFALSKDGDEYTLTSSLPFKKINVTFKPGIEFNQETLDGRDVKSTITIDGYTLHEVQKDDSGKETIIDRIFSKDEVKMILKIDNIVAIRIYRIHRDPYY